MVLQPWSSPAARRSLAEATCAALLVGAWTGCSDPRLHRRPADTAFSVGVWDGAGGPPQSSGALKLAFAAGEPSPTTVVAPYVARPMTMDGDASDWADIPASQVQLAAPGARAGLTEVDFDCRYRSRLALLTDPYTGASACPSACDPAQPPATREQASAGCTVPFPRFDHGVASVEVRAAYDDARVYLLLRWPDATEDRGARTWRKGPDPAGGWVPGADEEDRAAVSFDAGAAPPARAGLGCATACHLAGNVKAPAPGTPDALIPPAYLAQFTMHTGADEERVDAWEWRAGTTDPAGRADDLLWNAQRAQGDCPDPPSCLADCLLSPPGPACASVAGWTVNAQGGQPRFLAAGPSGQGDPDLDPPLLFFPGQGLPAWDAAFAAVAPDGPFPLPAGGATTLPGVVLGRPSAHRDDVVAAGRWRDGRWTVELSRDLVTGDASDAQFPLR